ncbi:MAG: nitronate monooxygenase [Clostridiales bacterium]|nr:nitronate monooxygenase [Clostridiales bacterium]
MNRVCETLGIKKPIIQGPMAWISTAPLVAAVSNAGGLGVLGVGFAPDEFVISQIEATKKLTDKPFAINTVMISENLDKITDIIRKMHPPVVYADTLSYLDTGLCRKYFDIWHSCGCKVIVKASFISDAVIADESSTDIVIVKGWEGGGHTSKEATTVLAPQAADCLKCPIVASGGIADGRGMAAAIALGADAIEMGTVFMAAEEVTVHPNVKDAVLKAGDMSTVITGYCTDEPCRQIKNALSDKMIRIETEHTKKDAAELFRDVAESSLKKAMQNGDMEEGAVMAGQIVPLVREIRPVSEILDSVLRQARETLTKMTKYDFN